MKLDGEKLLADLKVDLEFTNNLVKKIHSDPIYLAAKVSQQVLLEQLINSIKSGDYTIEDKGQNMKNKPNMYRVTNLVAEGNHYAGGWGERVKDVSTLEDATKFNKIQSVNEIFIEIGDEIGDKGGR